ncbi:hypothetical protein GYMLUDRAFT_245072 [Collybiopsis luxurians FD-317 M1]|uniref:Unplaced genomic scaffold GYMLUscaffold_30, whole genome shotgun sequence n=1 Tax=Collybiopsis luxurians FD-317 M1 TaxID=944289 RepID=A0A0D0CMK9_9AGAR|nr:hypothetical protein GYMLUDRAFT_245072 [Collybiopsis luxurians FD-317 M1]
MLPSNPRAHSRGLPSAPRSRSTGPSRQNARHSEDVDVPLPNQRQIKHQSSRSMASFPREPSRTRPPQSLPREPRPRTPLESSRGGWQRKYTPQSQSSYDSEVTAPRTSRDSDSTTSSVSSLFDRVRNGAASYASSFTSVEENDMGVVEGHRGRSIQKQRAISPEPPGETGRTDTGTGDGYTVWSRVAAAASSLTISVSKAWASNITTYAGEETPPGAESRLCRAMKAYHLSKCEDRRDLPAWLFSESERTPWSRSRPPRSEVMEPAEDPKPHTARNRPFPASAYKAPDGHQSISQDAGHQTSKASTDRLRQLREAKRQVTTHAEQLRLPNAYTEPRQRIGLPTGPAQRRR